MSLPTTLAFGKVTGNFSLPTSNDGTTTIPASGTVTFTPISYGLIGGTAPTTTTVEKVLCLISSQDGALVGPDGDPGVWLAEGWYQVECKFPGQVRAAYQIEVTADHTESAPLDLTLAAPILPDPSIQLVVNEQLYLDTVAARDEAIAAAESGTGHLIQDEGTNLTARPRLNFKGNLVVAADNSAADATDVTISGVATNDARLSDARTPTAHAASHAAGGSDPIDVTTLSSGTATVDYVLKSDGAGGLTWAAEDPGTGTGGHTIQDEGVALAARSNLNFVGGVVTVTDDSASDATDVTIDAVATDDARLSDARTPTAHAASHAAGGSDVLDVADLSSGASPVDFVPKSDGAGGVTWAAESAGGTGHTIQDDGAAVTARTNLNFVGTYVTVTDDSAADATDVEVQVNSNVFVTHWSTALNDYPPQPTSLPGCVMRWAFGPVQPTYSAIAGVFDHYTWADGADLP